MGPAALAGVNTFTFGEAVKTLNEMDSARRRSVEILAREPAIARVVTRSTEGELIIYYICRDQVPSGKPLKGIRLAARNAPAGRLASLNVGDDFEDLGVEIVEKAIVRPHRRAGIWDSQNSILEGEDYGPITVVSMRDFLSRLEAVDIGSDLLAQILAEDEKVANVIDGIRRNVITKMGLRDQPILGKRPSAAVYSSGLKFHGISASISLLGHRLAIRSRVCLAHALGSTPFILHV